MKNSEIVKYILTLLSGSFIRYGIMAVIVVSIELTIFWLLNSVLDVHYLIATILSLFFGIILNWLGGRYFVFKDVKHELKKEFALVALVSIVGVVLQSIIVTLSVEVLNLLPLVGKSFAIVITFFWNYIMRKRYIYITR